MQANFLRSESTIFPVTRISDGNVIQWSERVAIPDVLLRGDHRVESEPTEHEPELARTQDAGFQASR